MGRYRTIFRGGPFDGDVIEWSGRPNDGETILREEDGRNQAGIYVWSERLAMWLFKEHADKTKLGKKLRRHSGPRQD